MKFNRKKIAIFTILVIFLIILFFGSMNFVLPIKISMISGDIGIYESDDILFYTDSKSFNINEYILYEPSSKQSIIVAKIIEINPDSTFKVISTSSEPIDYLDQNNLKKEQIIGKIIANVKSYIFLPIVLAIIIIISYFLMIIVSKKLINN